MSATKTAVERTRTTLEHVRVSSVDGGRSALDMGDLIVFVNGEMEEVRASEVDTRMTLLQYLRTTGRTGTKLGCAEGGCGACTVVVSDWNSQTDRVNYRAVNACLAPLCSVHLRHVITVEGIGDLDTGLHAAQERIARAHGSQCGFCTPGIVMGLYAKLRTDPEPTVDSLSSCLDGNLCRCTGYRPIVDAVRSFATDLSSHDAAKEGEVETKRKEGQIVSDSWSNARELSRINPRLSEAVRKRQTFPPRLKQILKARGGSRSVRIVTKNRHAWAQPATLNELLALKAQHGSHAKIVVGNTELGIELHLNKKKSFPLLVSIVDIPEMQELRIDDAKEDRKCLHVGGAVALGTVDTFVRSARQSMPEHATRGLDAITDMLKWFASTQIRNVAGLASNIVNASPISDLCPLLMASGAYLVIVNGSGARREASLDRNFFVGYRRVALEDDECVLAVRVPLMGKYEFVAAYKQARRREDDIAIVNGAFRVRLAPSSSRDCWIVEDCAMAFGGMAPTTVRASKTEDRLRGLAWSERTVEPLYAALTEEMNLPKHVPGGQREFRMTLCASMLFKFYVHATETLRAAARSNEPPAPRIEDRDRSARFALFHQHVTSGTQIYGADTKRGGLQTAQKSAQHAMVGTATTPRAPVGEPHMHASARAQVSGRAQYCDDLPRPQGLLHAALVLSTIARGRITNVDPTEALQIPGVRAFFCAKDMKSQEHNVIGPVLHDEEVFASSEVWTEGQTIGIVVADSREVAKRGADAVIVTYAPLPAIISIDEAIAAGSFYDEKHSIVDGDVQRAIAGADVVVSGEMRVGGQEHFYLESNATLALPGEEQEMLVWASTQAAYKTQMTVAHVLGLPTNRVVCKVKRMGGGFGGKETRSVFVSCAAAFAAHKLGRPVSIMLDRDHDFRSSGQRHAFKGRYTAAANSDGRLVGLDLQVYANGGWSADLSLAVMDRALFHADNAYKWPTLRTRGFVCKTNTQSNTAFRGFGGPQGMAITEAVMEHLASALRVSPERLRKMNLYRNGSDLTHYGQRLSFCYLRRMWSEMEEDARVAERLRAIDAFNSAHRWRKRGLAIVPTKFGISFTAKFMNQAGALVHVYASDASVLVTHGGTEMGQGLHTKMCQIAARALGISLSSVRVAETATDKVPNASPTAASASSDIYGMAVLDACEQIARRLEPVRKRLGPSASFKQVVQTAYFERINLSAQGFYKTPNVGYDFDLTSARTNAERGTPFRYFTCGVACSEVEIDALTGDLQVLEADVLMDLGQSLNPAIDIGQIEGGWTQGFGLFTMEEMTWGDSDHPWIKPRGRMFTIGPSTYKIPSFADAPVKFNVRLLHNSPNPRAVHSSKAVGEPPLFLAFSVYCAARRAIAAARKDAGLDGHFVTHSPLTSERIRMACRDKFTRCGPLRSAVDAAYRPRGSW